MPSCVLYKKMGVCFDFYLIMMCTAIISSLIVGPALADEIGKDFAASNQTRHTPNQNEDVDEHVAFSLLSAASPVTTKSKRTAVSPRRISTRKRPHPEPDPLFLPESGGEENNLDQGEDEDAEGETDHEASESISTAMRREARRGRGVKRVRLSEPESGLGRTTRSRRDKNVENSGSAISTSVSVSAGRTRTSSRHKPTTEETAGESEGTPGRRSARRSKRQSYAEETEEEEEERENEEEEGRYSGPEGLAAALTRASRASRTQDSTSSTSQARPKPRPATASRTRLSTSMNTRTTGARQSSKRTVKPTEKGALLSPNKKPASILSRPISSRQRSQAQTAKKSRGKKVLDGVTVPPLSGINRRRDYLAVNGRSESPREIFDGVLLPKRRIGGQNTNRNSSEGRDLPMHLDEFVANGLGRQAAGENNQSPDPVLDRDEISSLGGSNKGRYLFKSLSRGTL